MGFRVTAPYVTVELQTAPGAALNTLGFYRGAILPATVDPESARRQVSKGMVEEIDDLPQADDAPAAGEVTGTDESGAGDLSAESPARPAANASKADWLAYAISQRAEGVSEDDARAELEPLTKAELTARFPVG